MSIKSANIPTHEVYDQLEKAIAFKFFLLEEKSPYDTSKHHRHSYYEIFFFLKGGGTHEIDFETFPVESDSIHFVSPGQVHLLNRAHDSNGFVILFSREFYHMGIHSSDILYELPFFNNNSLCPIINIPTQALAGVKDCIHNIGTEYNTNKDDKQQILHSYLNILLIQAKRLFNDHSKSAPLNMVNERVKKFKIAVEKNFIHIHSVNGYAELLCLSPNHLSDLVFKNIGISARQFIYDRQILEAKRLLFHSDKSISEIADTLCFEDSSYFSRFFKKHAGLTPGDFRLTIRKKYR